MGASRRLWLKGVLTTSSATEWTRNDYTKKANVFAAKLGGGTHTGALLTSATSIQIWTGAYVGG